MEKDCSTKEEEEEDKEKLVLKCVCFHGFSQNADAFRKRTGSIRTTKLKRKYEFVFLDAPHAVDGVFGEDEERNANANARAKNDDDDATQKQRKDAGGQDDDHHQL